jgi:hypothetical protein
MLFYTTYGYVPVSVCNRAVEGTLGGSVIAANK